MIRGIIIIQRISGTPIYDHPVVTVTPSKTGPKFALLLTSGGSNGVARPRAKQVAPLCKYTGVTRKVPFKLRPKDRKGAPLCRYTGVTRKVPFKLRPKDRKKVSNWY